MPDEPVTTLAEARAAYVEAQKAEVLRSWRRVGDWASGRKKSLSVLDVRLLLSLTAQALGVQDEMDDRGAGALADRLRGKLDGPDGADTGEREPARQLEDGAPPPEAPEAPGSGQPHDAYHEPFME